MPPSLGRSSGGVPRGAPFANHMWLTPGDQAPWHLVASDESDGAEIIMSWIGDVTWSTTISNVARCNTEVISLVATTGTDFAQRGRRPCKESLQRYLQLRSLILREEVDSPEFQLGERSPGGRSYIK